MAPIDLLPADPAPTPVGLLHAVGLLEWEPPVRDVESLVTLRPGRWVTTDAARWLLGHHPG